MNLADFLVKMAEQPQSIQFSDTMAVIDALYDFTPVAFRNGDVENAAGQNNGSCKIFAFAQQHQLTEEQTLACFGDYYRKDVLENPQGEDHQNIRQFMRQGWAGIAFSTMPLQEKSGA